MAGSSLTDKTPFPNDPVKNVLGIRTIPRIPPRVETTQISDHPQTKSQLFDGDALGQVARLVDVTTTKQGHVIGKELERHDGQ